MVVGFGENDIIPPRRLQKKHGATAGHQTGLCLAPSRQSWARTAPPKKQRLGFGGLGRREHHVFLVLLGATISVFLGSEMTPSCLLRHARVLPAYDCS
jgi:hypothetical protein